MRYAEYQINHFKKKIFVLLWSILLHSSLPNFERPVDETLHNLATSVCAEMRQGMRLQHSD
jgi:hypothetical protein